MFGNNANNGTSASANRPAASEAARIEGHLTHVIVSGEGVDGLNIFLDAQLVLPSEVESLSLEIIAPSDTNPSGSITALLSRYVAGADGKKTQQGVSLFPGTVDIIARGRRITVTAQQEGSFEGLWLGLGMRADGTSSELTGVQSLRVVFALGVIDAKLIWVEDGAAEDLLPTDR